MLKATNGTIQSSIKSLYSGVSINLSGGYHHACGNSGGGFCIYPDISISIRILKRFFGITKVMIIDLDAHQGNGHERDFSADADVFIIDCFRPDIYPGDDEAKKAIDVELHVTPEDNDQDYLNTLSCIPGIIKREKPEFILYNAGTDIMEGDPLSGLNINERGVIQRDELIVKAALKNKIPICMVLSGGYQQ
mmetsp:Transcript_2058/g.1859  ORF Transcript_2058/g.1859 Transcript_2058/m.1859 type:complete len:192 (+) Transcript_2058:540-1115(+)